MKFSELQLESTLNAAIEKLGWSDCTPIQGLAIPTLLEGKDVSGLAQTGTGKTAAFLVPLMERLLRSRTPLDTLSPEQKALAEARCFHDWRAQNFILILVPTRELAEQVFENITKLSEFSGLRGISVYGGTGYDKQKEAFRSSVEFVVATPGRLIDLYKEHFVDLKQVRAIVFDEADRMFDMGFKDDMKYILQRVPQNRQFLVFSATLNFDVLNTAYQFGAEPFEIDISRDQTKAENVKDEIFHVGDADKPQYLLSLLRKQNPRQAIVFSNFKMSVEKIAAFLTANGIPAMAISSLLSQAQRNKVMEQFKADNEKNILVATDVAARGLDIKGVDLVINYELPNDAESYVHRIGRTGRAGTEGIAWSMVGEKDVESLERIQSYLKHKLPVGWVEDTELLKEFKPMSEIASSARFSDRERGPRRGDDRRPRGGRPERGGPRGERNDRNDGPRGEGRPRHAGGSRRDQQRDGRPQEMRANGAAKEGHPESQQNGRRDSRPPRDHRDQRDRRDQRDQRPANGRPQRSGRNFENNQKRGEGRPQGPRHRRPNQRPNTLPPPAGVVQKVTGFFKRLFGE